jgi:hypothetical protein
LDALLNEARERIIQQEAERAELNALLQKKKEYVDITLNKDGVTKKLPIMK